MADRIDECLAHRRLVDLVRRQRHLPEGRGAARRRRCASRRAAAGRDRRAVPVAAGRARQAQPARERRPHRAGAGGRAARRRTPSSRRRSSATPPRCSDGERPARASAAARPELPRRPQHPRRDRAARRARRRATWCSRSAAAWGALRAARPRGPRTCTWSRSTAGSSSGLRDALAPFANVTLHIADALELDLAALEPAADQGRREPALRRSPRP